MISLRYIFLKKIMNNKPLILHSVLWAGAMLVVAISESKELTLSLILILVAYSTMFFKKKLSEIEAVNQAVESFEKK